MCVFNVEYEKKWEDQSRRRYKLLSVDKRAFDRGHREEGYEIIKNQREEIVDLVIVNDLAII